MTDGRIASIGTEAPLAEDRYDHVIDAAGCYVLPGVIDEHVDFLETQFDMIERMGLQNYIQLQSEPAGEGGEG